MLAPLDTPCPERYHTVTVSQELTVAPTIRIDDDVWSWLKANARPLEDTPNSVLRRVAGLPNTEGESLGHPSRIGASRPVPRDAATQRRHGERITGNLLNHRHQLGAKHALYHKDGTFYERLAEYPGVLCDPGGYVRYESAHEFQRDPRLKIGRKVNVPGTLASHPRYRPLGSG